MKNKIAFILLQKKVNNKKLKIKSRRNSHYIIPLPRKNKK